LTTFFKKILNHKHVNHTIAQSSVIGINKHTALQSPTHSIEVVVNVHAGRTTTEKEARFRSIAVNIEEVVHRRLAWSTTNVQTAIAMIDDVIIKTSLTTTLAQLQPQPHVMTMGL